jgi:predicted HTH domain antitoxin
MSYQLRIVVDVPDGLDDALRAELTAKAKTEVVLGLFKAAKISSGYGARMLGMTRREFLDLLYERKIPMVEYAEGELEEQIELAKQVGEEITSRREIHK